MKSWINSLPHTVTPGCSPAEPTGTGRTIIAATRAGLVRSRWRAGGSSQRRGPAVISRLAVLGLMRPPPRSSRAAYPGKRGRPCTEILASRATFQVVGRTAIGGYPGIDLLCELFVVGQCRFHQLAAHAK